MLVWTDARSRDRFSPTSRNSNAAAPPARASYAGERLGGLGRSCTGRAGGERAVLVVGGRCAPSSSVVPCGARIRVELLGFSGLLVLFTALKLTPPRDRDTSAQHDARCCVVLACVFFSCDGLLMLAGPRKYGKGSRGCRRCSHTAYVLGHRRTAPDVPQWPYSQIRLGLVRKSLPLRPERSDELAAFVAVGAGIDL